ncbi:MULTISPECIES: DUF1328 family protein [Nannocystis]|uniref:DUF1328 domain-containing protein n=1 Tax=Nannocystis pusilla TaxID=889268 RepID=A0ABS7TX03_9BACT|nr:MULTISPECIES: DUF1328 family protein [Nannocystis]MBZ5712744.1 DUF1328 domain-containing protein [Nannocystis pusilla]MCY1056566.1 DUF1328 domain-containing protein [Nannocystis sp. SCPEA4]
MLIWTVSFLTLALLAGALGFSGYTSTTPKVAATTASGMARMLFLVFLFAAVVTLVLGFFRGW